MRVDDLIVFVDGMLPAIFFPIGPPESSGSCAYQTEYCAKYCPAQEINKHEVRALNFFKKNSVSIVVDKIVEDLCFHGFMHVYWWPWGDCLPELTDKITDIMTALSNIGVVQNGYTRNRVLWENITELNKDNLKIGFHVDTLEEVETFRSDKIVCCPDISISKAEMYLNGKKIARCCGMWCDWLDINETRLADCQECYLYRQGCFYKEY